MVSDRLTKTMSLDRLVKTLSTGLFDMTPTEEGIAINAKSGQWRALKEEQQQSPQTSTDYSRCTGSEFTKPQVLSSSDLFTIAEIVATILDYLAKATTRVTGLTIHPVHMYHTSDSNSCMSVHFRTAPLSLKQNGEKKTHTHTDRFAPIRTLRASFHTSTPHPSVANTLRQPAALTATVTTAKAQAPHGIEVRILPRRPNMDLWMISDDRLDALHLWTREWVRT